MSDVGGARVVMEVIYQHVDEAAFLWTLRQAATDLPHHSLSSLATLDTRLAASLDALEIAGGAARGILESAIGSDGCGELFACAALALQGNDEASIRGVRGRAIADSSLSGAFASALGWLPFERVRLQIHGLLTDLSSTGRRIGLAAAVGHRAELGATVEECILHEDVALRARALRAAGELSRLDLLPLVERYLKADEAEERFAAAWSTALLAGKPEALSALAAIAQSKGRHRERAVEIVMRRGDPGATKVWQRALAKDTATLRLAVQGTGAIGDPVEIPWLIDQMGTPGLARVSGESFTTITGVDISYQDLEGERPEGFEAGPTEDPADENVEMDPDENLPWPDPDLIQKWWQSNRHSFQSGTRYLVGKPVTIDWCKQVLRIGKQRQRAAAALELAMRQPGTPLFEVRAPGFRQQRMLGL
jgi:uncharacterized protein (TIGR02270 family)